MNLQHPSTEQIIDYLHRELSPEEDAAMLVHFESCEECAAQYEEQALLSESLRSYARATERELPQGVVARIWDAVEEQNARPSFVQQIAAFFRPAIAAPVAALLIVGAYFGYTTTHRTVATTIDAAYYLRDHASLNSTLPFGESGAEPASLRGDDSTSDQQWVASTGTDVVAESR